MPASADIVALFAGVRFRGSREVDLQDYIEGALARAELEYEREVELGPRDRVDFLVDGVGIEVKVAGRVTSLTRQLHRYAQSERVRELVVVSTLMSHRVLPAEISGKPVVAIHVGGYL